MYLPTSTNRPICSDSESTSHLKVLSHGGIFLVSTAFFLSQRMGCMEVNVSVRQCNCDVILCVTSHFNRLCTHSMRLRVHLCKKTLSKPQRVKGT